jgi:hypothetical protein
MIDRTIRVVLQKRLSHAIGLMFLPTNKSMPFQMASTTRKFARVFMTTIFTLSIISNLLTVPHGEHLIESHTFEVVFLFLQTAMLTVVGDGSTDAPAAAAAAPSPSPSPSPSAVASLPP